MNPTEYRRMEKKERAKRTKIPTINTRIVNKHWIHYMTFNICRDNLPALWRRFSHPTTNLDSRAKTGHEKVQIWNSSETPFKDENEGVPMAKEQRAVSTEMRMFESTFCHLYWPFLVYTFCLSPCLSLARLDEWSRWSRLARTEHCVGESFRKCL